MSICRVVSCVVGKGCLLWPLHSLGKSVFSLCLASFCTPRPNLPVTPGISWLPTFVFQSPVMKKTSYLVLVLINVLIWLQNFHRTGETETLGGHKQNLVCTRTQEEGAVTPQKTEPDLPVSVQESLAETWVNSGLPWGQGYWTSPSTRPYCHYPYHSLGSNQTTGREDSPTHQHKIGLKIYWVWPCPSEQDPISHSVSPIRKLL